MDMTAMIEPRSDQLNADDLITGPRTVTIERVSAGSSEQPMDCHLVETPGRAYRPSKTMRRVMASAWGTETDAWNGQRLTLYREPTITFGRDAVGGIRISHMTGITSPLKIALTVTRGKRETFTVEPLTAAPSKPSLADLFNAIDMPRDKRAAYVNTVIGREIPSAAAMTDDELAKVIDALTELSTQRAALDADGAA